MTIFDLLDCKAEGNGENVILTLRIQVPRPIADLLKRQLEVIRDGQSAFSTEQDTRLLRALRDLSRLDAPKLTVLDGAG